MRRIATLVLLLGLSGCVGFGEFLNHTHGVPAHDPNIPMADSENVRRVLGHEPDILPLQQEPGNIWPAPQAPDPTLADIQSQPARESQRGFPPSTVPGATPALPAHRQPRPRSAVPVEPVAPGLTSIPGVNTPPPPASSVPGSGPVGTVVPTPRGPAVDTGGTSRYRQLTTPQGAGAIVVPNGNGTSTIINPNGSVQVVPTPR